MIFKLSSAEDTTSISNAISTKYSKLDYISEFKTDHKGFTVEAVILKGAHKIEEEKLLYSFVRQVARDADITLATTY